MAFDALLDRHGAGEGATRAGEHEHEAVAGALDLESARGLGGAAQDAEVGFPQALGRLGAQEGRSAVESTRSVKRNVAVTESTPCPSSPSGVRD